MKNLFQKFSFVLYLPENEVHELGLMFINYEIVSKGYQSIFLGQSVPMESLTDLHNYYDDITFISYFTVKPEKDNLEKYLRNFENSILKDTGSKFWILGKMINSIDSDKLNKNTKLFDSIISLTKTI